MSKINYSVLDILSNKKALCLEDEPKILKNLTESLELFFSDVVGVRDGKEALDEALSGLYDVLILDISVPHIDGIEIARCVREKNHKIPIIIITSHTEQEYLWRVVELKITRYIPKPFDKETIITALKDVALDLTDHQPIIKLKDGVRYDPAKKIIYTNNEIFHISKSESRLLEYFLRHKNKNITYEELFDYLWEFDQPSKEAIKTIVKELRKKIGKDVIKNLYGVGYLCEI
ncbi:response regulator transcription factor [Campylobacter sp. faydin G-24]|uniref:Response regulator transcription factor n=1 Tax=Campylobacter anatolicus TaxID=2829105 RepID=A0ABS5HKH7_9BACT|nr:response regulator transcription factor [Campylobacter anatolicus]MBR8464495.1 response regulator transcription factor [Campylobacter anatolicus]